MPGIAKPISARPAGNRDMTPGGIYPSVFGERVQGFKGAGGSKSESAPEQARPPETVSVPCVHTISSDNSAKAVIIHQSGFDPPIYI